MDRQKLKEELKRDEGIRLKAYQDTVGLWTIGVGHLLGVEQRMSDITAGEASALLDYDINIAIERAIQLIDPPLAIPLPGDDVRLRALVNMSFNLGGRLAGFKKFLAAYNARDWETAAKEMMDSRWAEQVGSRAVRLRDMILEGN
jgi:lysozyme